MFMFTTRNASVSRADHPVCSLTSLPADILYEISRHADFKADALSLALTCNRLLVALLPAMYDDVHLNTLPQCEATLAMLDRNPFIARHIQKLSIRLTCTSGKRSSALKHSTVSDLVQKLANKLDALNTFIWDADEASQYDDMWFALRMSCTRLHTIGTSHCAKLSENHSCLFQFKNLRGFRLILKPGFYDIHSDALQESRLWDMLIYRCPNLEELDISGAPFLPVSVVHPLCYARWPRLRSLSLGDIVLDWKPHNGGVKPAFITFLEAHPHLRSLRASRVALNPAFLSTLEPDSLSNLTRFGGSLEQLQGLARIHSQITSVAIDEPLVIRDMAPLLAAGVLQGLRFLTELRITFVFQSAYEGGSLIRSIVGACPRLTKLELICARRPSFTVNTIAKIVRSLHRLRHLRLTLVRSSHEDPLPLCAVRLAHLNPQLQTFCITFIPPSLPFPLQQSSEISSNCGEPGHQYVESGNYVVKTDEHGLPISIACTERKVSRLFPFSFPRLVTSVPLPFRALVRGLCSGHRHVRKHSYKIDLRPKAQKGLGMIFERSPAGEEMRMLMMMVSFGGMALWMFLR